MDAEGATAVETVDEAPVADGSPESGSEPVSEPTDAADASPERSVDDPEQG